MPWLVALDGELRGRRFPLGAQCLIGRGYHNHVVLDDARASRQHARISPEGVSWVLHDLKSANGTFVNGARIERHELRPNDLLRVGDVQFRFEDDPAERPLAIALKTPSGQFRNAPTAVGAENVFTPLEPPKSDFATIGLHELEDSDRKLRTMYGILYTIASTLNADEMLEQVVRTLFDIYPGAKMIAIYLREPSGKLALHLARARTVQQAKAGAEREFAAPPRGGRMLSGGVQMQAPMYCRNVVEGVIQVRGSTEQRFTREDLRLLNGLAAYTALGLENIRLHDAAVKQHRLDQDLALAQRIQKSFLPRQFPVIDGVEFVAEYQPAFTIGGDFYDVFFQSPERVSMLIGDVAGKGIAAALLMARIVSDLRVAALSHADPGEVLSTVNKQVLERQQHEIFVTVLYLTLDLRTREVQAASAGHPHMLVRRRSGTMECVQRGGGPPIGVFDDARYEPVRFIVGPGDLLLLFTDGVIEAADEQGRQFGVERIAAALRTGGFRGSAVLSHLMSEVRSHLGSRGEVDDITILSCGLTGDDDSFDNDADDRTPVG